MGDKYVFRCTIDIAFDIDGKKADLPNYREHLREECERLLQTMIRSEPRRVVLAYPTQVDGHGAFITCRTGRLSTQHAPGRFRNKDYDRFAEIARELHSRSKHTRQVGNWSKILKRADVPYTIGQKCYLFLNWFHQYRYVTFVQEELLRFWADEYKTKARPPEPVTKGDVSKPDKTSKAWKVLKDPDAVKR